MDIDDVEFDCWREMVEAAVEEIVGDVSLSDFVDQGQLLAMFADGLEPDDVIAALRKSDDDFDALCDQADGNLAEDNAAAYAY